jgi:hypothetical protein
LDQAGQAQIAAALNLSDTPTPTPTPALLLQILKERFGTHQAVRDYADANGVTYELTRDFQP